jgi:hypothetical protein
MGLLQFGEDLLQAVQVVGDGAVDAGFAAPAAAQIVFCKSSGGQAEGEMDGFMLR